MRPWIKAIVIAVVHAALVAALGAPQRIDRATLPRVWVLTAPYDPTLPIRGRYVRMRMAVEVRGVSPSDSPRVWHAKAVRLRVEGDRLVAETAPDLRDASPSELRVVRFVPDASGGMLGVIDRPLAFFIPEHVDDPARRPQGERLWVEVTVPRAGPPRPIRLGVQKGDGPIVPLETG
ncbi:MAG: hypothetical protein JSW68_14930 [Burkholderiales bacterium]|nr:MAG: hypothetical protein JSW68_14930 [Burkholderiales bacterium]